MSVTTEGVVVAGKSAASLATLLVQRRDPVLRAVSALDRSIGPDDIRIDECGRVVIRSQRLQKMLFESMRSGGNLRSASELGRLVSRTGGRLGTYVLPVDPLSPVKKVSQTAGNDAGGSKGLPPIQGAASVHEANFMCRGREGGLDAFCGEWDEVLDEDTDCNGFCGWY